MQPDLPILRIIHYSGLVRGFSVLVFLRLNKGVHGLSLDHLQLRPVLPLRREAELYNPPSVK